MTVASDCHGWRAAGRRLGLATCLLLPLPALAFECPVPQPLHGPAVLKETPARTQALSELLASGDLGNRVPMIVQDLRHRYPGVGDAEVSNYLMRAYCPIIAQLSGLSDAEMRARMQRFGSEIRAAIYSEAEPRPRSEDVSRRLSELE